MPLNNPLAITIREAIKSDVDELVVVVNLAYRGGKELGGWTDESHLLGGTRIEARGLVEILESPKDKLLVAEMTTSNVMASNASSEYSNNKKLVGCVRIELEKECAYIGMLSVDPRIQKLGIGKKLLNAAENFSQQKFSYRKSKLSVFEPREELINWYKKQGYVDVTGERPSFWPDDPMFGTPKVDKLVFVTLEKTLS